MRSLRIAAFLSAFALLWPRPAPANGRYPSANQLLVDPGNSSHLVLRTTFGLLLSQDAGLSWTWVCEDAIGYVGNNDPALAIFQNGTIAAGFGRDLRVSPDAGCSWPSPFSNVAQATFVDATLDPSDSTKAFFLSRSLDATRQVNVVVASETASALTALGIPLGDDISPLTLEVAPTNPGRVYVTAINADLTSVLLRSDDRGQNWRRLPIHPDETLPAYIAGVDPTNPDRLYLRLDGETTDLLLVSDDGGVTFGEAFSIDSDMLGFALSPDGANISLGGPPVGLFSGDAASLAFVHSPAPIRNLSCLKWTQSALIACALESTDGFTLARSIDSGQTFTPLFHLRDLEPRSCAPKSNVAALCPLSWPIVASSLGIGVEPTQPNVTAAGGCSYARPRAQHWVTGALPLLGLFCGLALRRKRFEKRRA